jgi:nuclease-like protein
MLTRLVALLLLCGALGVFGQDAPTPATYTFGLEHVCIHGRITGVVDGDTINVLILAKQQIRVRIAFIDAPEKGQPFGQRAKQATNELVFGKDLKLRPHTIDRHGRIVARVLVDKSGRGAGTAQARSLLGVRKIRWSSAGRNPDRLSQCPTHGTI